MFFWNFLAFSMIQCMLAIWFLIPLPLQNPACTSGSSWFTYCWSLTRLKDFEHNLTSMWNEHNCMVVWTFSAIACLWDLNENWPFPNLWSLLNFLTFLKFPCFLYDPTDVSKLISGSSAFSNSSLCTSGSSRFTYGWSLAWRLLSITLLACEMHHSCTLVWAFFGIALLWDLNENWPFPVLWLLLSFPNLLTYWVRHFNSIIF